MQRDFRSIQGFSDQLQDFRGLVRAFWSGRPAMTRDSGTRERLRRSFSGRLLLSAVALLVSASPAIGSGKQWIGTWATAAQQPLPGTLQSFENQTLRLIVHTSVGGKRVRI